jgi:hypothetical protein
MVTIL